MHVIKKIPWLLQLYKRRPLVRSSGRFHDDNNYVEFLETFGGVHDRLNDVDWDSEDFLTFSKFSFLLMAFTRSLLSLFYPLIPFTINEMFILHNNAWIMHIQHSGYKM